MAPSSLIIKGPRTRRAPKRYSPSPTTTTFPPSRTHKRTPKKKEKTSPKGRPVSKKKTTKPTPKKITKLQKQLQKKKPTPAIPTPLSPKTRKQKAAAQRTSSFSSYYLYSNTDHRMKVRPFNNKLTPAQISEIESLVSPWYTAEDIIKRLRSVRKKSMLDD